MVSPARQQDKRLGWLISLAVHALLVLVFFLINAWKAPNPPNPEYGVELNIGIEQEGFGEEQPLTPPVTPEEQASEEQPEETPVEPEQTEQVTTPTIEETIPDSKEEDSPVEAKPEVKPAPVEPKTKVEEKPKPAETKPKVAEKPTTNPNALMKPSSAGQGTKPGQTGDAGNPQGTPEGRALMGEPGGGGGGPSYDIPGWKWDSEPKANDLSAENGKLIFDIIINADGDIASIQARPSNFTPIVIQKYKDAVLKLSFSQVDVNVTPPSSTKGIITFIIKSK